MLKFLDERFEGRNLAPINIVSYDSYELGARDAIAITFKDLDTSQVYVETIDKPKYEVYILKKEYWDKATYMQPWEDIEKLDRYVVSYHWRDRELAKILGIEPEQVKYSTLLFGYDISVEHYYWIQFILNYPTNANKTLNIGLFDIESDIIQCDGFASPGEAPTSVVTFIDVTQKEVYCFALAPDCLPVLAESNPHYDEIQQVKVNYYKQLDALKGDVDGFIGECHALFDDFYGADLKYHFILFDDEIRLHQAFWEVIRKSKLDYIMAWNAPYDIRNLIERPLALGYEPESIICDDAYRYKTCFFEEDDNITVHKRNHRAVISIKPLPICMMWMYAGVRASQGRPESLKLNVIAQKELKDEKLNYDEEGDIKTFRYKNLRKYWLYNIKDVLLMLGILRATGDIDAVYDRCYENGVLIPEAFVSTTLLSNSLTKYFLQKGFVLGTNANRILPPFDYREYIAANDEASKELEELAATDTVYDPDEYEDDGLFEGGLDLDEEYD